MQAISSDLEDGVWNTVDGWRNFMSLRYPGARVFSEGQESGFRTCYRSWRFGGLEFAEIHSASRQSLQVPEPDRAAPDSYYLPLQLSGSFHAGQDGLSGPLGRRCVDAFTRPRRTPTLTCR